ncbi:coiled-coil domain-containing protein 171-like [Rhopilema esculentum]|uniref:coiled-coil domain-containing protein 171-like n=1 Tax=Rhopilema esculentum TaxID=499914 RepID=UPI0031D8F4F9
MASPLDSRYLKSPQSPKRAQSVSPEKTFQFNEEPSMAEKDEITLLRIKLSKMQSEQAERAHEYNEDCKNLEVQVTNLRTTVEKGEVLKQKLEYELTLAQRSLSNERRKFAEKEVKLQRENDRLKETVSNLENEISGLKKTIENENNTRIAEVKKSEKFAMKKENEIIQVKEMNKKLLESEQNLKKAQKESENLIADLQEKCRTFTNQRDAQNDTVRRLMKDIEFSSNQEERLESELSKSKEKLKHLEGMIESERTAHLETKFNFELLQVRIRDLEGSEASLKDCRQDLENYARDYKELQNALDQQSEACSELKKLMERKDQQYSIELNELQRELKEKFEREKLLSDQLDVHQTNFNSLRSELTEAKNHQTSVESAYGSNLKELEVILDNFRFENANDTEKTVEKRKKKKTTWSILLEDLRHMLRDYQTRLMDANTRLDTLKKTNDQSTNDCQRLKQKLRDKDKALEESQNGLKSSHLESARYKAECLKLENELAKFQDDSSKIVKKFGDQKDRYHQLYLQMEDLQETLTRTQETHEVSLYGIYQHLITGRPFLQSRRENVMTSFSATELSQMIEEQLDAKISALKVAEERNDKLEGHLKECKDDHEKLTHAYNDIVKKASKRNKEKEAEWKRMKAELEEHYKRIIEDTQSKTDKSKATLNEISTKLDKTVRSKEEMELENSKLQKVLKAFAHEKGCLLLANALISGSFVYVVSQLYNSNVQKSLMEKMVKEAAYLKHQIIDLVEILRSEMDEANGNIRPKASTNQKKLPGILKFRKGVIAILAINRFCHHAICARPYLKVGQSSSEMNNNFVILLSSKRRKGVKFKGIHHQQFPRKPCSTSCLQSLTSESLASVVIHSTKNLTEEIGKVPDFRHVAHGADREYFYDDEEETNDYSKRPLAVSSIADEAKKAFRKLFKGLHKEFPSSVYEPKISTYESSDSLASQLRTGLRRALARGKDHWKKEPYPSSLSLVDTMKNQLLAFIERLHAAEIERKSFRHNLMRLNEERNNLENFLRSERQHKTNLAEEGSAMQRQLDKMKARMINMVDAERYDALCDDLNVALEREAKAQKMLEEYTKQLQDLENRVEKHSSQEKSKDATMSETMHMLNNAKHEISKRDEMVKKLRVDAGSLENEKILAQRNLADLQASYKSILREQEIITSYIRAVGTVLEQSKLQATLNSTEKFDFVLPELVLPNEVLTLDGIQISKDVLACQDTVHMFYQAQNLALQEISKLCVEKQHLTQKLDILSEEVRSQRDSVMQIRGEMNALQLANSSSRRGIPIGHKSDVNPVGLFMRENLKTNGNRDLHNSHGLPSNGFFPLMTADKS